MEIIKEACIENATLLKQCIYAGAKRIELCDNLAAGGTTPSMATIGYTKHICKENNIELGIMIRARGGDFVYNIAEKDIMRTDMKNMVTAAIFDRFVIGALTGKGDIDKEFLNDFISVARFFNPDIKFTFNMAFDHIGAGLDETAALNRRLEAIKELKELGVDTVLTHGSSTYNDIFENIYTLRDYIACGKENQVNIMPGGGVTYKNLNALLKELPGIKAVHGTKIVKTE